jgi:hypothetical protein
MPMCRRRSKKTLMLISSGELPAILCASHADELCWLRVRKTSQVVSWWGVPCRTHWGSGFAVLSAMALKNGAEHTRPTERGVGTCESCGCQYSVKPEQLERRVVSKLPSG